MIKLFKRFRGFDLVLIAMLVGFIVAQVYFDVSLPNYTGEVLQKMFARATSKQILSIGGVMLLYIFGSLVCSVFVGYIATYLGAKFSRDLRADIFKKVQSFSFEETNKFSTPSLITRTTNDVQQVCMAVIMLLRLAIYAPINAVWAICEISVTSRHLTLAAALWITLLVIFIATIFMVLLPKFNLIQKLTDKLNGVARENLTGLRVVKAYNADKYQEEKFERANDDITKMNLFTNRVSGLLFPVMMLIMNGLGLTINWLGASLVSRNMLDIPSISVFYGLAMQVVMSFMMLVMLFVMVPRASVSAKRINEVLETKISITDPVAEQQFTCQGEVEFKNVSFKYPDAEDYVLKDISFKAQKGQTVAIIGSTGSGKSTLINLVPRFYDATSGEVLVDGVNIKNVKQQTLRSKIGYVPQKGVLFSGTVRNNIAYARTDILDQTVQNAAEIALAADFVQKMEGTYDADIAQGGKNVSGGQKQRLSIARAVAINPEIFIFDDSFSALDYKTDKAVRQNLKKYAEGATKLIVAQRIGTVLDADKIIVLEQGKMAGCGTHTQLMEDCAVYREIALSQLSAKELGI